MDVLPSPPTAEEAIEFEESMKHNETLRSLETNFGPAVPAKPPRGRSNAVPSKAGRPPNRPTDIDTDVWNKLSVQEKRDLIKEKVPAKRRGRPTAAIALNRSVPANGQTSLKDLFATPTQAAAAPSTEPNREDHIEQDVSTEPHFAITCSQLF